VHQPGLYFPYIHVRDNEWLKTAALYWPTIRRLVPHGYEKRDSPVATTFVDAGILVDEDPGYRSSSVGFDLLQVMQANADELIRDYSLNRAKEDWDGRRWAERRGPDHQNPRLAWIHVAKFPPGLVDFLSAHGLAERGRPMPTAWPEHGRQENWIGLHPALAGAYMTVLATRMSEERRFDPLTDQSDLRVATPADTVRSAVRLLLGDPQVGQRVNQVADGVETYVMLAMQHARPRMMNEIPAEKIVEIRGSLAEELTTFRNYVGSLRTELADLAEVPDPQRRVEVFAEHVQQTVEVPLRSLEKGLRLHKLEPTRSLLLASTFAPPLAVGTTLNTITASPAAATIAGTAAAIGAAWWQVDSIRTSAIASSPVGYLLDVRDHLTPKTVASRVRKFLRGTY
jgi:hypothetical protein